MKLVLEGIREIVAFLTTHYQSCEVNIVLMKQDVTVNEGVLVLSEVLTTIEEIEVLLASSVEASGGQDEGQPAVAVRIYGANTAREPENDNSPIMALPVEKGIIADLQDGILSIYGQHGLLVQITSLDEGSGDFINIINEMTKFAERQEERCI